MDWIGDRFETEIALCVRRPWSFLPSSLDVRVLIRVARHSTPFHPFFGWVCVVHVCERACSIVIFSVFETCAGRVVRFAMIP
jgi:hypothetical protein